MPTSLSRRFLSLTAFGVVSVLVVTLQTRGSAQYVPKPALKEAPTFTKDVAPIFYQHCTSCHRPGQIAPMSLLSYAEARPWAASIRAKVLEGAMPPWHADPRYGQFENDRRLTAEERDIIVRWATGGAPQGDQDDLLPAPTYTAAWTIGQPDAVFRILDDYPVPADGTVEYQYFEVPTNFTEDKWVQAVEIRPGAPSVVHHVNVSSRPPVQQAQSVRAFRRAAGLGPRPGVTRPPRVPSPVDHPPPTGMGSSLLFVAHHADAITFKPGTAMRITAGSVLVFQIHYMTSGTAVTDRTQVAFKFAAAPPQQELVSTTVFQNEGFAIPPGDPDYAVTADVTILEDVTLWKMLPHTHLRGKSWEYTVTYPDGRSDIILSVPKYDSNWQTDYVFKEPLKLPKGTKLHAVARYDNSRHNPWNPDPDAEVHYGEQTWEEMMITQLTYTVDAPASNSPGQPKR